MADLQGAHAGLLGVAGLQGGDHAARFVAQRARLIERRIAAGAHESAVALEQRKLVGKRVRKLGGERRIRPPQRRRGLRELGRQRAILHECLRDHARRSDPVADGGKVARAAAPEHESRQRAGEIGRCLEPFAQLGSRRRFGEEQRDRVVPLRDCGRDR